MKQSIFYLFGIFCLITSITFSQNNYGIIFPNSATEQRCNYFSQVFMQKPKEVRFSIQRENNNLYFQVNDKQWFNQLFKNSTDGIALDVVSKDRYACSLSSIPDQQVKGKLLKPIFTAQLKRGLKPKGENLYRVLVGKVPEGYQNKELEFNILFLSNKYLCQYYVIYDLEAYPWDLLDMGMYLDEITYDTKKVGTTKEGFKMKYKTLKFKIPFKKNKSNYSQEDLKPMYDSLRLTDFNIKKIHIQAYASVEGSLERNIELQEQRASSIAKALQTFQKPTITTEIQSSENWVEFLNDITGTKYESFKKLSKQAVKAKLTGALNKEMEPYLKHHRKAVVTLQLEKKDEYKNESAENLVNLFNDAVANKKLDEAAMIQNSLYQRLKDEENSPDLLEKMIIPNQSLYLDLLNKKGAYKVLLDKRNLLIAYNDLKQLEKLDPKNKKVKYNLVVMKFKIWWYTGKPVEEGDFIKQILALKKYGIAQVLVDKMMVNFNIIKSKEFMRKREYDKKDRAVGFILDNYKKIPLTDFDYLSLAQFLSYYANQQYAVELLDEKARSIEIDEDLLFYYLNLTLINRELTQTSDYRTIMLNAINMNKKRFCKLYNPFGEGGVTFQLLDDEYLRTTYCENCLLE